MSVLKQLYGEAKGIERSLDMMNKNLQKMQIQDRRSNQLEEKYRQEILKNQRRARQDDQRNRDHIADTLDNAVGKKAGKNLAKGGLLAALAAGLGAAVAASIAKNKFADEPETGGGGGSSPSSPGGSTSPDSGSETDTTPPSSGSPTPSQPSRPQQQAPQSQAQPQTPEQKGKDVNEKIFKVETGLNIADLVSRALRVGKFAPVVGQAFGAADLSINLAQKDYWSASFNALGMLPGPIGWVGDAAAFGRDILMSDEERNKKNLELLKTIRKTGLEEIPYLGNLDEGIKALEAYIKETEKAQEKQLGGIIKGFQSGGFSGLVPDFGQPSTGDHFYTSVQPGSYIMNRNLVKAMGYQEGGVPVALEKGEIALPPGTYNKGVMDYLNHSAFPRFQAGGIVQAEHAHTGAGYSVGKDSKGRPSVFSKEAAEALMKAIKASDGAVKTSDITSSKRSPEHNKKVGGVPGSNHLSGNAVDIHGGSKAWLKEHGPKYGWHNLVYSGHDGHFDFRGGGSSGIPTKPQSKVKEKNEETAKEGTQVEAGQISGGFGKYSEVVNSFLKGVGGVLSKAGLSGILGEATSVVGDAVEGAKSAVSGAVQGLTGASESAGKYKNLLNLIASKESGAAGYNAYNEGGHSGGHGVTGYSGHSAKGPVGKNLTEMSIAQIMKHQKDLDPPIHAAGRYQIIGPTMRGLMSGAYGATGVNPDDIFTPEVQDKLAIALIKGRMKSGATAKNFGQEWIGLQNVNQEQLQRAINNAKQRGGHIKYMSGGNVLAQNLQQLNDEYRNKMMMSQEPIIVYEDEEPPIAATHSGGADNNDPFYLPTRSTCWAAAIMEYRERTFNQGY